MRRLGLLLHQPSPNVLLGLAPRLGLLDPGERALVAQRSEIVRGPLERHKAEEWKLRLPWGDDSAAHDSEV